MLKFRENLIPSRDAIQNCTGHDTEGEEEDERGAEGRVEDGREREQRGGECK